MTLKHWQLFMLIIGPQTVAILILNRSTELVVSFVANLIGAIVYFGWLWNVANYLNMKISTHQEGLLLFRIFYFICAGYSIGIVIYSFIWGIPMNGWVGIANLVAISFAAYCIFIVARLLKSFELGRLAYFDECLGDTFLFFFFPIGIWVIQPRINNAVIWKNKCN